MDDKTCKNCDGMCCKYVALEIDTPETKEEFENIRWYVAHKNIGVYVDSDDKWHIEFKTPCEFLGKDNLCKIREKRPEICRGYSQDECLFHNDYSEKHTFNSIEEIDKYLEGKF